MNQLWWLTAIAAAGCTYTDQVAASDSTAFFPVARIRIDRGLWLGSPAEQRPSEESDTYVEGEFSATMAAGDLSVTEPVGGVGDYDMRDFSLLVRVGRRDAKVDGAILAGLQFGEVDAELQGPISDRDLSAGWLGLAAGLEGGVAPVESVRAYLRLLPFLGVPSAVIIQAEVGVEWTVVDPVRLVGGYRYWDLRSEGINFGFGTTSLDLTLSGPFAGVVLQS